MAAVARPAHPLPVRIMHWLGAVAVIFMMLSGWAIYNASPSLPFTFPRSVTLGGWLAAGIAWHISAMWLLFADGIAYLAYGFASGHFRREIRPVGLRVVLRDLGHALRFRLGHRLGHYNAVQRLLYAGVIVVICVAVATGLAIWKSVQFGWLTWLFGGYPFARGIHLATMFCILAFLVPHLLLVALFPRTLLAMIVGTRAEPEESAR
jgi:thiosulfate reductase cytochrome b subunit